MWTSGAYVAKMLNFWLEIQPWSCYLFAFAAPPDVSTYQYDETSGYYYDPLTTLYYDANTQVGGPVKTNP